MSLIPGRFALIRCVPLVLLLIITCGCGRKNAVEDCNRPTQTKTVVINSSAVANPDSVYVCKDDKVNWVTDPADLKFEVEFKNGKFPFKGNAKKFKNGDQLSAGTKRHFFTTNYPYKITVYTPNPVVSDPQVVAGGGL